MVGLISPPGGGGGGGYYGGGGGGGGNSCQAAGGGGGSGFTGLATNVVTLSAPLLPAPAANPPPMTTDPDYRAGVGVGGAEKTNGGNGLVVVCTC